MQNTAYDAATEIASHFRETGLELDPPDRDYFLFVVQQTAFVRLAGGDPETLRDGNPELGQRIVNNGQNIIDTYWRAAEV